MEPISIRSTVQHLEKHVLTDEDVDPGKWIDDIPIVLAKVVPVTFPTEDNILHTDEKPFCEDTTCPCHMDPSLIKAVHQQYLDGLLTKEEAIRTFLCKML